MHDSNNNNWETALEDALYSIRGLDETPLKVLSARGRYELLRRGDLPYIKIGARKYVTRRAICAFLANKEASTAPCHAQAKTSALPQNDERQPVQRLASSNGEVDVTDDSTPQ